MPRAQWKALAKAARFCREPSTLWAEGGLRLLAMWRRGGMGA